MTWRCSCSARGIKPADVVNLEPGSTPFPESVIDMLSGGLGWPEGGWPEAVSLAVLGPKRHAEARARYESAWASAQAPTERRTMSQSAIDEGLRPYRRELAEKLRHDPTDDRWYSHLMYPQVFAEFLKQQREYGDVSVLPTPAFFYGLSTGEEITVDIEEGKTLIIRLVSVGAPDADGRRALSFELNGMAREAYITDKGVAPKAKTRPMADLGDALQVAAPIPGLIAALYTSVGAKVSKGDKLFTMEAMKMQTTVFAPVDGVVAEQHAAVGETVEAKDLIVRLRG